MTKQRMLWALCLILFLCQPTQADNSLQPIDSLLTAYQKAGGKQRVSLGRKIIALSAEQDELLAEPLVITDQMPRDSIDFMVWFAAERFYYNNSYFEESLTYIDRALALSPLSSNTHHSTPLLEIHATLLCDRGYCFFKTGHNTEATEAELQAEAFAKKHNLMQPLARSYNYLASIDITLGYTDEAKHFVAKAIETDRKTGSDINTHNYLGIACEVYSVAKEPEQAVKYGEQAVEAARKIGYDAGVVNHLSQLSYAYNRQGNLEKALEMSLEAVRTVEKMPIVDRNLLAISLEYVSFNLLDMKRNAEAVPYIRRAIALQQAVGNYRSVCYDHKSLAEALEPDKPREALQALRRYSVMMDSLHYDEMHAVLSKANAQLHNDELQVENAQSRRENRIILISSIVAGLLLLAVIAALVYAGRTRTRSIRAMRQLQAAREEFFTNITHEFRTPLTVILGVAERLKGKVSSQPISPISPAEPELLADLDAITRNGEQLLSLVNQLLDISKIRASAEVPDLQQGNVAAYVGMIVERFRPMAELGGVELLFRPQEQNMTMAFSPDFTQKMVDNLLSNALKFTPEGGTVTVGMHADDRQLTITIGDTGCGILPEDLPHVFEPFFQGSNNTFTGTGVGLALVRQLVEALGGTISVASTVGQGTEFKVVMPTLSPSPSQMEGIAKTPIPSIDPIETIGTIGTMAPIPPTDVNRHEESRPLILVVEDNRDVSSYIGSVLAPQYEVVYAYDGTEGLAKAEELVPDVIVTDVMMPGIDGLELCRRIRANHITDHIPVVVITARVTDEDRLLGIEAGADAYLNKPFRADELLLRVEKLLEQRRRLMGRLSPQPLPVREGSGYSQGVQEVKKSRSQDDSQLNQERLSTPLATREGQGGESSGGSAYAAAFLAKLDGIILRLMTQGDIDAKTVASELNMSLSQFTRKLRAVADNTPAAYITARRMEEARRMLAESPKYTMADVAIHCGFADSAHFAHVFRRLFGCTPTDYVRQLQS